MRPYHGIPDPYYPFHDKSVVVALRRDLRHEVRRHSCRAAHRQPVGGRRARVAAAQGEADNGDSTQMNQP